MNIAQQRLLALLSYALRGEAELAAEANEARPWSEAEGKELLLEARRHGLSPLLYHRIKERGLGFRVPPQAGAKLREDYLRSATINIKRFNVLTLVLRSLKAAGVPTIVLKGAYLAEAVYGNPALRPMADVDLLVRGEDLARADTALAAAGFSAREFHLPPPSDENEFYYANAAAKVNIEVHWEMTKPDYPFRWDVGPLWASAGPARIAGVDSLALSPEDLIIHIGLHAAIHRFAHGLRPLCDLAEVVSRRDVNWDLLAERARTAGVGRSVRLFLALAAELLRVEIPGDGLRGIDSAPLPAELWEEAIDTVFKREADRLEGPAPHPNLVLFLGRKRWRDKLGLAARRIFPSRRSIAARHRIPANSPRVFLYYPGSFWTLLRNNAPALRALLSGRKHASPIDKKAAALMDWMLSK